MTIDEVGNAAAFIAGPSPAALPARSVIVDGGLNTTALGNADPMPA